MREDAARALGGIGDARAVAPLCAALRDENSGVRQAVTEALEKIGVPDDPAIKAWITVGKKDWVSAVSFSAPAVEPLITAIGAIDIRTAAEAVEALVKIGPPSVEPLLVALRDEKNDVRAAAAEALGRSVTCGPSSPLSRC